MFNIFISLWNRIFSRWIRSRPVRCRVRFASARCHVASAVFADVYAADRSCEMSGSCPRMQSRGAQSRPRALSAAFTACSHATYLDESPYRFASLLFRNIVTLTRDLCPARIYTRLTLHPRFAMLNFLLIHRIIISFFSGRIQRFA